MKKYKVILLSGGFDPVHKGHIECIQNAKKLADEVWIGLNNESWLRNKKGKSIIVPECIIEHTTLQSWKSLEII